MLSILLLLSGALTVQSWSMISPETVVYRRSIPHNSLGIAPQEALYQRPSVLLEDRLQSSKPQEVLGKTISVVHRKRPVRRHRPRPIRSRPRVLNHGDPVSQDWHRRSYGFLESEERLARQPAFVAETGSHQPDRGQVLPTLPPGHRRVGLPLHPDTVNRHFYESKSTKRVGTPISPEDVNRHRGAPSASSQRDGVRPRQEGINRHLVRPASALITGSTPREYGARTVDLESLYASRYGSKAPRDWRRSSQYPRRPSAKHRPIAPVPPVYRNLCRTRSMDAVRRLPAPLRSICQDYLESRGRAAVSSQPPREDSSASLGRRNLQEARKAPFEVQWRKPDPRSGNASRRPVTRNIRKSRGRGMTARSGESSKSSRRFYKPYWPYKKNGQRYY